MRRVTIVQDAMLVAKFSPKSIASPYLLSISFKSETTSLLKKLRGGKKNSVTQNAIQRETHVTKSI